MEGNVQQVVIKKDKDTVLIYILEECESLLMPLLMVGFDLFPAVQLHTEPEYKDETMTVYQIPLAGELWCCRDTGRHVLSEHSEGSRSSFSLPA